MRLRFSENKISEWADRYLYGQCESEQQKEESLLSLQSVVQNRGFLMPDELHRLACWKSQRRADLTFENSADFIKSVTSEAFDSRDDWEKLSLLTRLSGVAQPTASAILHYFDLSPYPILDIHALFSVGFEWQERTYYRADIWRDYTAFCRDIVIRNKIANIRTLDRALWRYSYEKRDRKSSLPGLSGFY